MDRMDMVDKLKQYSTTRYQFMKKGVKNAAGNAHQIPRPMLYPVLLR